MHLYEYLKIKYYSTIPAIVPQLKVHPDFFYLTGCVIF